MIDERVLQTLRDEFAISEARLGEYVADALGLERQHSILNKATEEVA